MPVDAQIILEVKHLCNHLKSFRYFVETELYVSPDEETIKYIVNASEVLLSPKAEQYTATESQIRIYNTSYNPVSFHRKN